jgi:hypothetical protein
MSEDTDNQRLRVQLDHAAAGLDDMTVAQLRAARKRAVAVAQQRPSTRFGWLPLSAAAAAFIAVTVATLWWRTLEPTVIATEEIELSLTRDDPEFFTDLEFFDWIRREQDAG